MAARTSAVSGSTQYTSYPTLDDVETCKVFFGTFRYIQLCGIEGKRREQVEITGKWSGVGAVDVCEYSASDRDRKMGQLGEVELAGPAQCLCSNSRIVSSPAGACDRLALLTLSQCLSLDRGALRNDSLNPDHPAVQCDILLVDGCTS